MDCRGGQLTKGKQRMNVQQRLNHQQVTQLTCWLVKQSSWVDGKTRPPSGNIASQATEQLGFYVSTRTLRITMRNLGWAMPPKKFGGLQPIWDAITELKKRVDFLEESEGSR